MANYKRKKPRDNKVYRNGIDGRNCSYCGSNWNYAKSITLNGTAIKWEYKLDGIGTGWRYIRQWQ